MQYFVFQKEMENNAYDPRKDKIKILFNDGSLKDITKASDNLNISALSKAVKKYYLFAPNFLIYDDFPMLFLNFKFK